MPGEHFDASSEPRQSIEPRKGRSVRPFIGVQFQCCSVYARVTLNLQATAFIGHCPRCGRRVEFILSDSGSNQRFFTVY